MMRSTQSMSVRRLHADPGELAHERGLADHLGEQPGHLEVEPVLVVEQLRVPLQHQPSPVVQRLVEQAGDHAPGLVRVVDALAVERVDRSGGVADHRPCRSDLRVRPTRPSGCGHRSARDAAVSGSIPQYSGAVAAHSVMRWVVLTLLEVAERRQQADADVDRAVAHREDPAVARQRVAVAVADVEARSRSTARRAAGSRSSRGWPCPAGSSGCGPCPAHDRIVSWPRRR